MVIKTGQLLKDYKGDDIEGLKVGNVIEVALTNNETGGAMKMFTLAQKAYTQETLEVDEADMALIKKAVEETKQYNNLAKGQVLLILEGVKEGETKKKEG